MRRRIGTRILQVVLVSTILAAGGIGLLRSRSTAPNAAPEIVRPVRVVSPERVDLEERLSLRAFVEADETITILPLVSGTILNLNADVGDAVIKGDLIALIDPARYELARIQAEASFTAAESTFHRTRRLYEADATTVQNFDHARAQYEAARSQLDLALLQLGYTEVRSPISGVVLERHLAGGDIASPDRPLVTIGDIDRLVVRAAVPEEWFRRFVRNTLPVDVRIEAGGEVYRGRIRTVAPYVSPRTRTFEVVSVVEGLPDILRPGMSVTVSFIFETRRDVPAVPLEVLGYGNTLWYVEDNRARSIEAPRLFSDGAYLQIPEEEADRIFILEGHHFLSEYQPVRVLGDRE